MIKHRIWLTEEQRSEVTRRYIAGEKPMTIAKSIGVCANNVRGAIRKAGVEMRDRAHACRRFHHNENAFDVLTPETEYWIGFLFADGSASRHRVGSPSMSVGLATRDRSHLVKLLAFMGSNHKIYERMSGDCYIDGRYIGLHRQSAVNLRSKNIVEALMRYGMCNKSLDRVATAELALSRHFWRGVVDGDGYVGIVSAGPRIGLCGGLTLMNQFVRFAQSHGLGEHTNARRARKGGKLHIVGFTKVAAGKLIRTLYEDASVFLSRKNKRAKAIIRGMK